MGETMQRRRRVFFHRRDAEVKRRDFFPVEMPVERFFTAETRRRGDETQRVFKIKQLNYG